MTLREDLRGRLQPIYFLGQNPITLTGAVVTTSTALTTIAFWFYDFFPARSASSLYRPARLPDPSWNFYTRLLLIPIGIWLRRRTLREKRTTARGLPSYRPRPAGCTSFPGVGGVRPQWPTSSFLATASYRGVEYMDSANFCGTTCHTVMAPEYATYQNSPHSRVECVECHIGPGAGWFVRSKLSGLRQVFAVSFHTYSRPIPSPVKYLRPARETCEQCHWPQRFTGDKFLVNTGYKDDEKTPRKPTFYC